MHFGESHIKLISTTIITVTSNTDEQTVLMRAAHRLVLQCVRQLSFGCHEGRSVQGMDMSSPSEPEILSHTNHPNIVQYLTMHGMCIVSVYVTKRLCTRYKTLSTVCLHPQTAVSHRDVSLF